MMKNLTIIFVFLLSCSGCGEVQSLAEPRIYSETLAGTVIRKEWSKSMESWNAGGSEYYVLSVKGGELPPERQTAGEGVILRPSKEIPFEDLASFTSS